MSWPSSVNKRSTVMYVVHVKPKGECWCVFTSYEDYTNDTYFVNVEDKCIGKGESFCKKEIAINKAKTLAMRDKLDILVYDENGNVTERLKGQ